MSAVREHAQQVAKREADRRLDALGLAAVGALHDELALDPKPGLVSLVDSGSHRDMDASTFMRSLFALRHAFPAFARAGARRVSFAELETLGMRSEARMFSATRGVNTHRGAIFTLGLLCSAAGAMLADESMWSPDTLRCAVLERFGPVLTERARTGRGTHGAVAARRYGLRSASDEAALGFPALFDHVVPALRRARLAGLDDRRSRLDALFAAMATLDDTNLAHRGGLDALRDTQAEARAFLERGGARRGDAIARAQAMHRRFVVERRSPGGAADLLAAACWIERVGLLG